LLLLAQHSIFIFGGLPATDMPFLFILLQHMAHFLLQGCVYLL